MDKFSAESSRDPQQGSLELLEWREQFILTVLRIVAVLGIALIVSAFPTSTPRDRILFIGLYVVLLTMTILQFPYTWRATLLLGLGFIVGINSIAAWGPWKDGSLFLLAGVALASILFDKRVDLVGLGISGFSVVLLAVLQQNGVYQLSGAGVPSPTSADWFGYSVNFLLIGVLIATTVNQFKGTVIRAIKNIQNTFETLTVEKKRLEEELLERGSDLETQTSRLRTSASTARVIAEVESINDLLDTTTRLIAERFEYQHVGLYILNEQKNIAFLQSASSDAGRKMIGQGFQMGFDKRNPFKLVAETNRPLILLDGDPSKFVKDENFPLTRSRMILPLTLRGSVIGFLDIQSDQPRAFTVLDTDPLQILADLATLSFDNARLVNETRSLILQLDANMAVQTQRSWAKFTERIKPAYQYTPAGIRPLFSHEKRSDGTGLNIPLILHGQKIGMINLKRKGNEKWSKRERALVEKIAEQVTLALENSRLVDEAQKSAMRDQMIANISTSIRETLDVNAVIRTAATELRKVFDLKEAEIIVGSPYQNRDRQ